MEIVFFFTYGDGDVSASEGIENAMKEEKYLLTRYNDVKVKSFIGNSYNEAWDAAGYTSCPEDR